MAGRRPLPSLERSLLSGGTWAFGGKALTVLVVLASNALLARLLSPEDLGAYFLAFSVVSVGALAGSLGLNLSVVRFVAESIGLNQTDRARRVVGVVFCLGAVGALVVGLLYLSLGDFVGESLFGAPNLAAITGLVAGWMAVMVLQMLLAETFRGFNDIRLATLFSNLVTGVLLTACLALLWLLREEATLATVVLLAAASSFASTSLGGWLLYCKLTTFFPRGTKSRVRIGEVLSVSWPLLITNLTLFAVAQADVWVVGAFRPQEDVAIYGAAVRTVSLILMPLVIVDAVVSPVIAEKYAQRRREELENTLRTTATVAGIPAFLTLAVFILFGGPILGLVYGDYYRQGALVLALLSIGQIATVWSGSCRLTLTMTGHQTMLMVISTIGGVAMLVAALGVVGPYGTTGVALTASLGLALQHLLMLVAAKYTTGMWTHASFEGLSYLVRAVKR
jgi:O-antigen/teichoic acid export membrane protein